MLSGGKLKEHTLNRLGYGPSAWHSDRYDAVGHTAYVAEQLDGTQPSLTELGTTIATKLDRDITERRQLEVALLDFWFNHFNISTFSTVPAQVEKTISGRMVGYHQNTALLPHVLGDFGVMLLATAKSPSMLDYLDNRINYEAETVNGITFGPNENYAREVMELHTIGVDGGYVEDDIIQVALILTGWSVSSDEFLFKSARHDTSQKVALGITYPAGRGMVEGEEFLAWLADRPAAATFLASKLVGRFINEVPPAAVTTAAATTYASSGRNLGAVMSTILSSADFLDPSNFRAKIKPPHRYVASAVMAMGVTSKADFAHRSTAFVNAIRDCGELPYVVDPPTGYPEKSDYWVSGSSMFRRFKLAQLVAYDGALRNILKVRAGTNGSNVITTVSAIEDVMVPGGLSADSRNAVLDHVAANAGNNNQRVSAAAHMILCSPEFVRY